MELAFLLLIVVSGAAGFTLGGRVPALIHRSLLTIGIGCLLAGLAISMLTDQAVRPGRDVALAVAPAGSA